jgi:hypothetical protein
VGRAGAELRPVQERLVELLKGSDRLFADETQGPVLDPGRGRTKTGYLWALARYNWPWGGTDPPAVSYLNAPGRGAELPWPISTASPDFRGWMAIPPTRSWPRQTAWAAW